MQTLFIVLGLIGLIMTFFGAKWTLKSFKAKEIIGFPLNELEREFVIINPRLFTLCILTEDTLTTLVVFEPWLRVK
jgi:hypothetical protein